MPLHLPMLIQMINHSRDEIVKLCRKDGGHRQSHGNSLAAASSAGNCLSSGLGLGSSSARILQTTL